MNIRRVLAVAAIPFLIGTFGFVTPNQAYAANPSNRNAQISQQSPRPQISDKKPQVRHSKPSPNQKKHPPQHPQNQNQGADQNRVERNNR
ncbi:hypothetical protein CDG77_06510 [Nostoc sp. 'Peltigera membranacea cyanobiont' 213]|uniref:hypothetical protein n=1 Tax=unclassified Nostoc TaxID=2593658 RepID=UPI000B955183|nr:MULTISPECIES: hypothetical protein [unclassified Nostoc]AVH62252.1 hypothetical protein NPM_0377 [Nostoc sp. 'Peltigera membranacea cyanobiont' N6]OYD98299.1 hypothetical protein CDG77_06510 [Nostoc sp. 'Peltigera membranacea cyanobiont' 213]